MIIEKILLGVKKNISLKNHTTFKIGGKARYFFVAKTKKDLIEAVVAAKKTKQPFFVLGGGSNLLFSDRGFNGLVIKILTAKYQILNNKIIAEAGENLAKLVDVSAEKSLSGLEWAAGIPGTVGGAVWGNAGAFGKSMKDIVQAVEALDSQNFKIKKFKNKDCKFDYRESIFKKKKNLIILSANLVLEKGKKEKIKKQIKNNLQYKREFQPLSFPSAGSVFKNHPPIKISKKILAGKSFSAGELIEKCNLKGKTIGRAKISEKHANFIVNLGKARSKDVMKLINLTKKKVKKKFSVNLKEEIKIQI